MKKLIVLFIGFVLTTILTFSQDKSKYVDLTKKDTLTISVISQNLDNFKTLNTLQTDLSKSVENQSKVTVSLADVLISLNKGITAYTKEIEKRNKSDSNVLITSYFNYTNEEVKTIINRQKFIRAGLLFILLVYLIVVFNARLPAGKKTVGEWSLFLIKNTVVILLWYELIYTTVTIFVNPQYLTIKDIIHLYT